MGRDNTEKERRKKLGSNDSRNIVTGKTNKWFYVQYNLLANIRVAFNYLDKEMMKKIIANMLHPKLKYAAVVWSLNKKEKMY